MTALRNRYNWLEIKMRPKSDGLHDSGYRYIQVTGVYRDENRVEHRDNLHQWSDHVLFQGFTTRHQGVNIDFTAEGVMRLMPWGGASHWASDDVEMFFSSAVFKPEGNDNA